MPVQARALLLFRLRRLVPTTACRRLHGLFRVLTLHLRHRVPRRTIATGVLDAPLGAAAIAFTYCIGADTLLAW